MPDWDKDSPQLRSNLRDLLRGIRDAARRREALTVETAQIWHMDAMRGLAVPESSYMGKFCGEQGLERVEVLIGSHHGVSASEISSELAKI